MNAGNKVILVLYGWNQFKVWHAKCGIGFLTIKI